MICIVEVSSYECIMKTPLITAPAASVVWPSPYLEGKRGTKLELGHGMDSPR